MNIEGQEPRGRRPGAIAGGMVIIALGIAMMLDTMGVVDVPLRKLAAPLILIALGTAIVMDKGAFIYATRERTIAGGSQMRVKKSQSPTGGLWLIGIGAWMLVSQLHVFGFDFGNSWPLFVIITGIILTVRGVR